MSWFRRKPREPQATAADARHSAQALGEQAPRERADRLETTHPVFQLKAGMSKAAVIALLGERYLSVNDAELRGSQFLRGPAHVTNDASAEEAMLYSNSPQGHDIEIVFRSGLLVSAKVKKKNADRGATLLVRIDQKGLAAAKPYRAALRAAKL